jgi:transcriptional regulator with XRE-family HTH domain
VAEYIWTAGRKLVALGERLKLTQEEIADVIHVDRGTIGAYKSRHNANPSVDKIMEFKKWVEKTYQKKLSLEWFFDKAEPPEKAEDIGERDTTPERAVYDVPYWGEVPCGDWEEPSSDTGLTVPMQLSKEQKKLLDERKLIVVKSIGFSNAPRIVPGQYLLVKRTSQKREGYFTLARDQENRLTLKMLNWNPELRELELQSYNPTYGAARAEEATVLGYAVGMREDNEDGIRASVA